MAVLSLVDEFEKADEDTRYIQSCFNDSQQQIDQYPKGFVPLGDYLNSCRNITVDLKAECQNSGGTWQQSQLEISNNNPLQTEVSNENGNLSLSEDYPVTAGYCYIPGGNFKESSRNINTVLTAECQTSNGDYITSSLDITLDINPIIKNNNGILEKE